MRTIDEFTMVDDTIRALEDARKTLQGMRYRYVVLSKEENEKVACAGATLGEIITSLRKKNHILYKRLSDLECGKE